ncbi:MAG: EAL domain-containing protein [Rhodopseudomonas palustris]|uniref:EAL domain-containing protein n=1 Tax=Rhodopseudomonas palustris TaxID=1076 RepID=A0A933S1P0_RHOPL|nr:EAL domain-containing protein [Rhodopseudomonas palustris]
MSDLYRMIMIESDLRLLAVAAATSLLVCIVGVSLFHRSRAARGRKQVLWLVLVGTASGFGAWATHYIAMLSYYPAHGASYNLNLKLISLLLAIAFIGTGAAIARMGNSRLYYCIGGAVVGLSFTAMLYCDIMAMEAPVLVVRSPAMVFISIAVAAGFSVPAAIYANRDDTLKDTLGAAVLFSIAILVSHMVALAAMNVVTGDAASVSAASRSNEAVLSVPALAVLTAGATAALLGGCLLFALADRRSHRLIARQKVLLDIAIENMPQSLCVFDASGRARVFNRRYAELMGIGVDELKNMTLLEMYERRRARGEFDADPRPQFDGVLTEMRGGRPVTQIDTTMLPGRVLRVTRQPLPDGGWVSTIEDITDARRAQEQIARLARHDALTNLPNRATFCDTLESALRAETTVAVLYLDLDRFKEVNDALGHPVGDALLIEVSWRLTQCISEGDTVARLGGDEFAVVQISRGQPTAEAAALAARIVEAIGAPFDIHGHQISIGASVGIALAPRDGDDADAVIQKADLALYRAKSEGRGDYCFFEAEMEAATQARNTLASEMRTALTRREFVLHYRPIRDLDSGEIIAFEAMLRWQHPTRGQTLPDEFMPLAEDCGLIVPIGDWMMKAACAEAVRWPADVRVSVGLSRSQLRHSRLVPAVATALLTSGLAPHRLELEIAESTVMEEGESVFATLHALRGLGISLSLDHFGASYSALSAVEGVLFDRVKIDPRFIEAVGTQDDALAALASITRLGRWIGSVTATSDLDTSDRLDLLRAAGCTEIQGRVSGTSGSAPDARLLLNHNDRRIVA